MTGAHNFFRLYALVICDHAPAQRNVEDFDFVSEVPHSNHHTVGTASWQNNDRSSLQSAIILHCHVCLCLSNHNISSTLLKNPIFFVIFQGDPDPLSPLWIRPCIAIDALSLNISSQPPQTQNMTSADIFVQPISKLIPTPSLVSFSDLSIIFIG